MERPETKPSREGNKTATSAGGCVRQSRRMDKIPTRYRKYTENDLKCQYRQYSQYRVILPHVIKTFSVIYGLKPPPTLTHFFATSLKSPSLPIY
jgi:hypothetical protein